MAALLLFDGATASASGPDLFGFGTRSPAMAGTGAATSSDYEAVYANPAGLAFAARRGLTVGFVGARYRLRLDGNDHPVEDTNGVLLGAQLPLPLGDALAGRFVLGLGFYFPVGVVNRASAPFPDVPSLALLDERTQTVSVMVAGAVRIADGLSIGGGVLALAALVGTIRLGTDGAGHITTQSEQKLVADYAPIVGARWDISRRWHLGAVFRGRSRSRYDIRVDSRLAGVVPFELPRLSIAGTNQYDPLQAALEGAFAPSPSWLVVAQLQYQRWSEFAPPTEPATMGTKPLPSSCPADQPATCFADRVVPRVAVEWRHVGELLEAAVRAGYFFAWSPAPDAAPARTLLDASRHVITVGGEVRLRSRFAPFHGSAFYQWHQAQPNDRVAGSFAVVGLTLGVDL